MTSQIVSLDNLVGLFNFSHLTVFTFRVVFTFSGSTGVCVDHDCACIQMPSIYNCACTLHKYSFSLVEWGIAVTIVSKKSFMFIKTK